jgi:hypothetical protein
VHEAERQKVQGFAVMLVKGANGSMASGQMLQCCPMDLQNPKLLYRKAGLFVLAGLLASAGILLLAPSLQVAALLTVAVWSLARAYYFAFYVVEHYADPGYRFAGLWSFIRYMLRRR